MAMPKVGSKAPTFKLKNQAGEWVSLSDFKDQMVVVYFYPKAMTPGCTTQACGIRDSKKQLAKENITVLAISPDSCERLAKFAEKEKLNFNLLSDEDHTIAEKYGVWGLKKFMGREFMGILRTTFIIDGEGKVAFVMDDVKTKTHHQDFLEIILKGE